MVAGLGQAVDDAHLPVRLHRDVHEEVHVRDDVLAPEPELGEAAQEVVAAVRRVGDAVAHQVALGAAAAADGVVAAADGGDDRHQRRDWWATLTGVQ